MSPSHRSRSAPVDTWIVPGADGGPLVGTVRRAHGERGAVLVAHGLGEHLGRYGALTAAFLDAGISVLAYDHRGHGSTPGRRAVVDAERLVADHLRVRTAAEELLGEVPLALFGHSLGGLVTAASVLSRARGADAVVLSSAAFRLTDDMPDAVLPTLRAAARVAPGLPTKRIPGSVISRDPAEAAAYEADLLNHHGGVPLLSAVTMMELGRRVLADAPRWGTPTLVLHGTGDRLVDPAGSLAFVEAAGTARTPRPTVELVEVDGGHHECFHDLGAAALTARTVSWVVARLG